MPNNLTPQSPTYDTTTQKFGTGSLNGGYGVSPGSGAMGTGPVFTWELWIKRAAAPAGIQVAFGSTGAGYIGINASGQAQFNGAIGNINIVGTPSICDGAWHHLAMVGTSGGFVCYVDGTSIGSSATAQGYLISNSFGVGAFNSGANPFVSGNIDEVAVWSSTKYTGNFTPAVAAYTGNEANLVSLYHLDSNLNDSTAVTQILPNNAAIVYSPYNWNVTSGAAKTINAGAYFKAFFTGSTCVLNFDVTNNSAPVSEIYYRIDGYEVQSPWTKANVVTSINITLPSDTSGFPYHLIEVVVKSTSETINRWNAPSNTAVVFTGLTLNGSGTVVTPGVSTKNLLVYGDSITEGVRTVNSGATNDTDRNDAMMGWSFALGRLLGAEVGVVGFGATGLVVAGSGNVPALTSSYNNQYAGQARTFSPTPSLIVLNIGHNDSGQTDAAVSAALITVLNGLLSACPSTPIAVMRPFSGIKASALQTGIAGCNTPSLVTYVDTTGYLNLSYGVDALNAHPSGPNNLAIIAPLVANAIKPLLNPRRFNITVTS